MKLVITTADNGYIITSYIKEIDNNGKEFLSCASRTALETIENNETQSIIALLHNVKDGLGHHGEKYGEQNIVISLLPGMGYEGAIHDVKQLCNIVDLYERCTTTIENHLANQGILPQALLGSSRDGILASIKTYKKEQDKYYKSLTKGKK